MYAVYVNSGVRRVNSGVRRVNISVLCSPVYTTALPAYTTMFTLYICTVAFTLHIPVSAAQPTQSLLHILLFWHFCRTRATFAVSFSAAGNLFHLVKSLSHSQHKLLFCAGHCSFSRSSGYLTFFLLSRSNVTVSGERGNFTQDVKSCSL